MSESAGERPLKPAPGEQPQELWSESAEQLSFDQVFSLQSGRLTEKKPVEVVYMYPTKGRLTFMSKKTWVLMHDYAVQQGLLDPSKDRRRFRCLASSLIRDGDYDSNDYAHLRKAITNNIETVVTWGPSARDKDGKRPVWQATSLLADCKFITVGSRLYVDWSYSDVLLEQLRKPGAWLKLSSKALRQAKSITGLSLYMICERFRTNHNGLSEKLPPEVWHAALTGIPRHVPKPDDTKKFQYKYWKRDTLLPAIAEVNSYQTGFTVNFVEEKVGAKVVGIQLIVQESKDQDKAVEQLTEVRRGLLERLVACGLSEPKARAAMRGVDVKPLSDAVATLELQHKAGKIKSPAAYFGRLLKLAKDGELALEDGEGEAKELAEPTASSAPSPAQSVASHENRMQGLRKAFLDSTDAAKAYFESLQAPDQTELVELFKREVVEQEAPRSTLRTTFAKHDWAHPIVKSRMWTWLRRRGFQFEPSDEDVMRYAWNNGLVQPVV